MKRLVLFLMITVLLVSCASKRAGIKPSNVNTEPAKKPGEKLIWSSSDKRPEWTVSEPEFEGDYMYFVGLSDMYATEKLARTNAMRSAVNIIVSYLGTEVREKFENIVVRYGLSSDIADPTKVSRNFETQVKDNIAVRVKAKEWYIEQWRTRDKDIYWKSYVLAKVPKSALEQSFINEINRTREKLKEARAKAKNERAKKQYEDAMNAFNRAAKDGFEK